MPSNSTFRIALGVIVGGLLAGIVVLAALVTASGPRVRHTVVQNPSATGGAAVVGQGLTLVFDRPVKSTNFDEAVEVRPQADHTVSHRDRQLSITFDENLLSNTDYSLTLAPTAQDDTGKRMVGEYRYDFATAEPSYTYLERNYSPEQPDQIIERWPLSRENRTLFEADTIEYIARGGDHLAVVMGRGNDAADELHVINLENGEDVRVAVPGNVKISDLEFSPLGDQFAFVTRANVGRGADEAYRKGYDGRLYRYDTAGERLRPVDALSEGGNVWSVLYSNDGQALLLRTLDGAYYLMSAAGTEEPVQLGNYMDSGGFNRSNTKILFQTVDGVAVYDARTKELRELLNVNSAGSTPTFLHNSDALAYGESVTDPDTGQTTMQVTVANEDGMADSRMEAPPPSYYFRNFLVSYDDRYILIDGAVTTGEFDSYAGNPQLKDARLVLFDRSKRTVMDQVRGVDPVWNR